MKKEKFRSYHAPTIKKIIEGLKPPSPLKDESSKVTKIGNSYFRRDILGNIIKVKFPMTMKAPIMKNSTELPPEKPSLIKSTNLRFKIGDSCFQRDIFGETIEVGGFVETSILDLGVTKTCRRCKKEFHTGKRRSLVICPECKTELKNRPSGPYVYEKICPICHDSFKAKRSDAVTCGKDRCRKALYRKNNP